MPRVEMFYAVKTCPDERFIKIVAEMDCGFDVASTVEM